MQENMARKCIAKQFLRQEFQHVLKICAKLRHLGSDFKHTHCKKTQFVIYALTKEILYAEAQYCKNINQKQNG